jgi:hypothetical protein
MEIGKNQFYSQISKSTHFLTLWRPTRRNKKSYANYYVPVVIIKMGKI